MGAIVLDLRPGLGIGPFTLGNSRSVSEFSFYMIELNVKFTIHIFIFFILNFGSFLTC